MTAFDELTPKVLIVGSGPSGLVLALTLLRNGIPVRVIEKSKEHRIGQRGSGIMPRSLELFEALGIYDKIQSQAIYVPMMRMYKMPEGVEILKEFFNSPWEDPTNSIPYNNIVLLGQDSLDKILRAELSKLGCEVELGFELQSFEQSESEVKVSLLNHNQGGNIEEASYRWLGGADGARGAVRKLLGLKLTGETTTERFVTGDMEAEGFEMDRWHMWGEMSGILTSVRHTDKKGVYTFIIGGSKLENPEEICLSDASVTEFLKKSIGQRTDLKIGKMLWVSPYRVNIRMTETFRSGRVFLVGDAAHIHSPAGGQGLNTGIQDSFNLGWKLALVLKGASPPSLLETYNEERIPVVSQMLNITTNLYRTTLKDNNDAAGWDRSGQIKQLGVNYRWSSIVVDEDGTKGQDGSPYDVGTNAALAAGDRAPDAPGLAIDGADTVTRMFKLLSLAKHTVLIFASTTDAQTIFETLKQYPADLVQAVLITGTGESISQCSVTVVMDTKGLAHKAYMSLGGTTGVFVIRPDGVIGARVKGSEGIIRYFRAIYERSI